MAIFTEKAAKEDITGISTVIPDFDLNNVYIVTFRKLIIYMGLVKMTRLYIDFVVLQFIEFEKDSQQIGSIIREFTGVVHKI